VDWSLRCRDARYTNYCATGAHVLHKSGASTDSAPGPNLLQLYLVCRGQALVTRKHARGLARVVAPLRALAGIVATGLQALLRPAWRPVAAAKWRGFRDGRRRYPPDLEGFL
jgi:GT2 family glycosyltransferase